MKKTHRKTNLAILPLLFLFAACTVSHGVDAPRDYSRLLEFIKVDDRSEPLCAFNDFEVGFDEDCHRGSLEFLNDHPKLIRRIQLDLNDKTPKWKLERLAYRLVFVPENRETYANLFKTYCNDAIHYTLGETELNNPYEMLRTITEDRPEMPDRGVAAFLVHNLAKEYVAKYSFTNKEGRSVAIELRGTVFSGEVGAYTTNILMEKSGEFSFVRDDYTIWQNSAKNPYTVLTVPVEETLHIVLREYTEREIEDQLELYSVQDLGDIERIADDWMAVEEAIVGGLVHTMLPQFLETHVHNFSNALVEKDIESKMAFHQYRHLKKGIEIVEQMGCRKAVKMYREDPSAFKDLLT
jgi:hypothetical protein